MKKNSLKTFVIAISFMAAAVASLCISNGRIIANYPNAEAYTNSIYGNISYSKSINGNGSNSSQKDTPLSNIVIDSENKMELSGNEYHTNSDSFTIRINSNIFTEYRGWDQINNRFSWFSMTVSRDSSTYLMIDLGGISNEGYSSMYDFYQISLAGTASNFYRNNTVMQQNFFSCSSGFTLSEFDGWLRSQSFTIPLEEGYKYSITLNFYVVDGNGNIYYETNNAYPISCDQQAPVGNIYADDVLVSSGTHTNASYIYYMATDNKSFSSYINKHGSSQTEQYVLGTKIYEEGRYYFYSRDTAGNISVFQEIIIDRTAPNDNLSASGYSNTSFSYYANDNIGLDKIYYRHGSSGDFIGISASSFEVANTTENNGDWYFYSTDFAGNQTQIVSCILDTIAPSIPSLNEYSNTDINISVFDANFNFLYYYKDSESVQFTADSNLRIIASEPNNGKWNFYAVDKAGNTSEFISCIIDTILPVNSTLPNITNQSINYGAHDNNDINKIYYRHGSSGDFIGISASSFEVANTTENNGDWYFYSTDFAGNKSSVISCILDTIAPELSSHALWVNEDIFFRVISEPNFQSAFYKRESDSQWTEISLTSHYISALSENNDTWYFYAQDRAGNISPTITCTLDTVRPENVVLPEYTNAEIVFNATDEVGIALLYYRQGSEGTFTSVSASSYTVAAAPSNNDTWYFYAQDRAGNISPTITCTLDTVRPENVVLPEYTNAEIVFSASDLYGVALLYYRQGSEGAFTSTSSSSFTVEVKGSNNGVWYFYAQDRAGNISPTITCTLDTVRPENVVLPHITNKEIVFKATDSNDIELLYYRLGTSGAYMVSTMKEITIFAIETNNGVWHFYAQDKAGNLSNIVYCILDTIAPDNKTLKEYTNENLEFTATDVNGISSLFYRFGDSGVFQSTLDKVIINAETANCGLWQFYAVDIIGNVSSIVSSTLSLVDTFGNQETINNSYKITSWYKVTLPSRIFTTTDKSVSGVYSFENYDAALAFAIAKEVEYRCSVIAGGWIYVSATNEAVSQIYTDKVVLDAVIKKYAASYISPLQKLSFHDNNNYNTPINNNHEIDAAALTSQHLEYPSFLKEYESYNLYLCSSDFSFVQLKLSYANVPSFVDLRYIANDASMVNGLTISITYDKTIGSILKSAERLYQGYYFVREYDAAGNIEEYIIYIDLEEPVLQANVQYGDGSNTLLQFNVDYIKSHSGTFHFISFSFSKLTDNADSGFLCVLINGIRLNNAIYLSNEDLPILNYNNGYSGKYKITVYDRSFNYLEFEIIIAAESPSWIYTNLANDTKLTITMTVGNDNYNAITTIYLFKILSDGSYLMLDTDDDGVAIDLINLTYTLRVGGKYTAKLTDIYGRTVEMKPIFYQKDLPQGVLSVEDGARTNKDVTFKYVGTNTLTVYVFVDGVKTEFNDYMQTYQQSTNTYTATFIASERASCVYLIFLCSSNGLFIEYSFEIDCVIGDFEIKNSDGIALEKDSSTNKSFSISWTDMLVVRYYASFTVGGPLGEISYQKGMELTSEGLYYFTIRDDVGNTISFTIYLKTSIAYKITGEYSINDNVIISNNSLVLTVLDAISEFSVANDNGHTFTNGSPIIYDGLYVITIKDNYHNNLVLIIEIDTVAPEYSLSGVTHNSVTKNKVTIEFDGLDIKAYTLSNKGAVIESIYPGKEFNTHGTHYVRLVDNAGNITDVSFTIDIMVDYEASVLNGAMVNSTVVFNFLEDMTEIAVYLNGQPIEYTQSYSEEGYYTIIGKDSVGNIVEYAFEVIPKRARQLAINVPNGFLIEKITLNDESYSISYDANYSFTLEKSGIYRIILSQTASATKPLSTSATNSYELIVEIDNNPPTAIITQEVLNVSAVKIVDVLKENYIVELYKNGKLIDYTVGKIISSPGKYVLIITDDLGNSSTYEFEIRFTLNSWSMAAIFVGIFAILVILILVIKTRKIKVR